MTGMVGDLTVNRERMRAAAGAGFSTATDIADWLVREANIPFRDAHHITGRIVAAAEAEGLRARRPHHRGLQGRSTSASTAASTRCWASRTRCSRGRATAAPRPTMCAAQAARWKEIADRREDRAGASVAKSGMATATAGSSRLATRMPPANAASLQRSRRRTVRRDIPMTRGIRGQPALPGYPPGDRRRLCRRTSRACWHTAARRRLLDLRHGSLIWNPETEFDRAAHRRRARLAPALLPRLGPSLPRQPRDARPDDGLDRGGTCTGVLYRLPGRDASRPNMRQADPPRNEHGALAFPWRWINVDDRPRARSRALTFAINRKSTRYIARAQLTRSGRRAGAGLRLPRLDGRVPAFDRAACSRSSASTTATSGACRSWSPNASTHHYPARSEKSDFRFPPRSPRACRSIFRGAVLGAPFPVSRRPAALPRTST